jgi:hypothetical protein
MFNVIYEKKLKNVGLHHIDLCHFFKVVAREAEPLVRM